MVAPDTCRPFSRDRQGLILGEGAAMLVLEPLEPPMPAERRSGARSRASACPPMRIISRSRWLKGPRAPCEPRWLMPVLPPEAIGYINAHGTGTSANDATETEAIREVFCAHADRLMVSSTKSMHGHALGAAGALEAAATLAALRGGMIPPTANFTEPDPACDLDVVPNHSRPAEVEWAISNSFAFGGLNAVLVFRRA